MKNERVDRRVQRTHQLLSGALISLIVVKGNEAITVQNIIDQVQFRRNSPSEFRNHSASKLVASTYRWSG
ncbi:MAG: TetR/AcrR family transcriptional regulator [Candidatus Marinimicrobia bacterium]|nr:TetR/AcrR family transcriptional regulator [Candidatus Neomarinimicrobiota bacterium]